MKGIGKNMGDMARVIVFLGVLFFVLVFFNKIDFNGLFDKNVVIVKHQCLPVLKRDKKEI